MKPLIKIILKTFFLSGLLFAGLMAGSDYSIGKELSLFRFISNTSLFGFFMSLMAVYNYKKQGEK